MFMNIYICIYSRIYIYIYIHILLFIYLYIVVLLYLWGIYIHHHAINRKGKEKFYSNVKFNNNKLKKKIRKIK